MHSRHYLSNIKQGCHILTVGLKDECRKYFNDRMSSHQPVIRKWPPVGITYYDILERIERGCFVVTPLLCSPKFAQRLISDTSAANDRVVAEMTVRFSIADPSYQR